MKKDIEWLKKWIYEYEDEIVGWLGDKHTGDYFSTRLHGGLSAIKEIREKLNQLDEPEILSQEWIDKNKFEVNGWNEAVHVEDLQNLLVPKQERLTIPNYVAKWISEHHEKFDLYPALRRLEEGSTRDYDAYKWYRKNTRKFVNAYLTGEYEIEQEQKYYAKIKGHENIGSNDKYWNYNTDMEELSIGDSEVHPNVISEYVLKATKDEWANLGITDDNADFELVEELKECRKLIEKNMRY